MPSFPGSTADNVELARLDGTRPFTGDVAMGTHKITGLQAGTASDHGVNKGQLDAVAAATSGKYGFQYTFGTGTTNVDPTPGKLTFDSATPSAIARINVDIIDADGNDLTNWLAALDDAIGNIKGFIYWRALSDDTKWGMYRLDSITSPGGYVSLNVTHIVSGLGGLPATTAGEVTLEFDAWGNGAAAGNGLTGTSAHSVLAADGTVVVGVGGVKRAPVTGAVLIPDGSNVAAIAPGAIVDADVNVAAAIALNKLAPIGTATLLGRTTAGTGPIESLTLNATLSFSGATLQRAALTGDVTAPAGSNTTAIAAGVITNAHVNASAGIAFSKLQTLAGLSVLGNASNATAAASAITGTDGQALVVSGTVLNFGQLNLGLAAAVTGTLSQARGGTGFSGAGGTANRVFLTTDGTSAVWGQVNLASAQVTGLLPFANIASIATSTLLGRTTAGTGPLEQLTLNATLSFSGSTLQREALTGDVTAAAGSNTTAIAAGVIVDADVNASAAIALSKLANLAANSLLGRAANTIGAMAAITAVTSGHVLNYTGSALVFSQLAAGAYANNTISLGKLADSGGGTTVIGRSASFAGPYADIQATVDEQVFRRSGGALGFGTINLASSAAVAGRLGLGNFANGTTGRVLVAGASDPAYGTAIGNTTDVFSIAGSTFSVDVQTTLNLQVAGGVMLSASYLSGRRVLGICGNVTATQMPSGTGDGVAFWSDAAVSTTAGFPVGGGALWNDSTFGLTYKGKNGVETTLAQCGDSGNTTKRRMVGLKTQPRRSSLASGSSVIVDSFDVSNLNGGGAITSGAFKAVCHFVARGGSGYVTCGELMACVEVVAGVPTVGTDKPSMKAGSATAFTALDANVSGTTVRMLATPNSSGGTYETISYWEFFEFEP